MNFLSPAFLWALPLIAVPVLVHFFNRRQRDVIRWGAMEFLLASATPRRRFLRLRDLLLMLIRIAVVLFIIAALAQPMLSLNWIGASGPRDVVIVLDDSLSTARKLGGGTVFDREIDEAARLIAQLGPADVVRVLTASPAPEWLTDMPLTADGGNKKTLISRLRQLTPNEGSADLLKCAQEAVKAGAGGRDVSRIVTVITDGQAYGWRPKTPELWSPVQTLAKKSPFPVVMNVIVPEGATNPAVNLTVESLSAARAVAGTGQPVTLTASIRNTGAGISKATSAFWSAGEHPLGVSAIPALQPSAGTSISISEVFATPGLLDISCRLGESDDLPLDDSARFLLEITKAVPILVVEGEPQTEPMQSDTQYLLAALGGGRQAARGAAWPSVFQPRVINYQQLSSEDLTAFQCVILANVPRLAPDVIQKLVRHVNSGGGLWIALGEQTDVDAFNRQFTAQGGGLSPAALKQPVGDAGDREKFTAVAPPVADHPATAMLSDIQRLDIDRARVYRRHQFDLGPGTTVSVLLRAEGGAPLAVEKFLGRGRVILQAFPLGLAWSNLPLCHAYVVMVHEWLWYLTEPGLVKHNLQPGELLQATQPAGASSGGASLLTPGGLTRNLVGQAEDERLVFRYAKTMFPGEYRLDLSGGKEGSRSEKFLVSRDPGESILTPLTESQIQALSKAGGLSFGPNPLSQPSGQRVAAPPKPVAHWLLLALAGLMAVEAAVAFWITSRRRNPAPAVVFEPGASG
jgi:hypothetical protein